MTKVSLAEARKKAESDGLPVSRTYLKIQEGTNRMRIMSEFLPHEGQFQDKPTFKWLCYVLDHVDAKVKPFVMPHKIYEPIEVPQADPEYAFDEVRMPYDVTINATRVRRGSSSCSTRGRLRRSSAR